MPYMGASPGLRRGATGETPSAQGERSRGRGGWRQRKCSNYNRLCDQPKVLCQRRHLRELPSQPGIHIVAHPVYLWTHRRGVSCIGRTDCGSAEDSWETHRTLAGHSPDPHRR